MKKIVSFVCLMSVVLAGAQTLSTAPVNPAFIKWQEQQKKKAAAKNAGGNPGIKLMSADSETEEESENFGCIPIPVDFSYLKNLNNGLIRVPLAAGFPSRYDLREYGFLTPVRDQKK